MGLRSGCRVASQRVAPAALARWPMWADSSPMSGCGWHQVPMSGAKSIAIDSMVEDPRCGQPRDPQRGEKRAGLPAPAGGVVVDARAARCPAVPPKQIGGAAVSSRNTRWATSQVGAAACHATRAAATSGRSCSDGRPFFLTVRGPARRARPSAHSRAWRGRPSAQPACDPGAPQSARPRCVGAAQACSLSLDARRHLARFAPPLFQ